MARRWRWLGAVCLVGFPLGFIVFAGTGIHPGPWGTTQEQIQLVAAAEARWRLVHLVLAAASLLGIGAVVTLWTMAVRGRSGTLAWAGGPLATGLLLLGLVGGLARSLRLWEAALLVLAAIGLVFTNPGLHAPAQYPLVFVLVVFGSLAIRWLTGGVADPGRSPAGPATHGIPAGSG
jgi:hypothetical protein